MQDRGLGTRSSHHVVMAWDEVNVRDRRSRRTLRRWCPYFGTVVDFMDCWDPGSPAPVGTTRGYFTPMARVRWFTHAHSQDGTLSGQLIVREDLGMCPVDANVGCPVVFKDKFVEELWPMQKIVPLNIILAPHPKSQEHYMVLRNSAAYLTPPSQSS